MKAVIQRSKHSFVKVDGNVVGEIEWGMVVLLCIEKGDTLETVKKAAHKILNIRMFEEAATSKMNLSLSDLNKIETESEVGKVRGAVLCISQFTLSWEGEKGHRPSFDKSMPPVEAEKLYDDFCLELQIMGAIVKKGVFGASMDVQIQNDGPVTFFLKF